MNLNHYSEVFTEPRLGLIYFLSKKPFSSLDKTELKIHINKLKEDYVSEILHKQEIFVLMSKFAVTNVLPECQGWKWCLRNPRAVILGEEFYVEQDKQGNTFKNPTY